MKKKLLISFLTGQLFLTCSYGQIKRIGTPDIINFERDEYKAAARNWAITQDLEGIIYFANDDGILSYDGDTWKVYKINKYSVGKGLHTDPMGRIFAGSYDGFGYLEQDEFGNMDYHSLLDSLPRNHRDFSGHWRGFTNKYGMFFQSLSLFFYDYNGFELLSTDRNFKFSAYINDRLFVQDENKRLFELKGNKLYQVPGSDIFRESKEIWAMFPIGDSIIIGTQKSGLYLYDGFKFSEFKCEANAPLIRHQIFNGIEIGNGFYSIGTKDGIYIINKKGQIIQHINKDSGLNSNGVLSQFLDSEGLLWLGLDNGISLIKINSPYTYLGEGMGVEGAGNSAAILDDKIYLGTSQNLYVSGWDNGKTSEIFKEIPEGSGPVWTLQRFNDQLLCGYNLGTLLINKNGMKKISDLPGTWKFLRLKHHPQYIIAGNYHGLSLYRIRSNSIEFVSAISGLEESCRVFEEDDKGDIWMTHNYKGAFHIKLNNALDSIVQLKFYDDKSGFPNHFDIYVNKLGDRLLFCTENKIYRYNSKNDNFEPDTEMNTLFHNLPAIRSVKKLDNGNIWFASNQIPYVLQLQNDSSYKLIDFRKRRFVHKLVNNFEYFNHIDEKNVLFGVNEGFVHYNTNDTSQFSQEIQCYLRHLILSQANDTVAIFGTNEKGDHIVKKVSFPFNQNSFRIEFISPSFPSSGRVLYQFMLDNFDKSWSKWQDMTQKEYTNIPSGHYTFRVKAMNEFGTTSNICTLNIEIQPPWYRSLVAYIIYILVLLGAVYGLIRYIMRYLEKEKLRMKLKHNQVIQEKEEELSREMLIAQQKIIELKNEKLEYEISMKKSEEELKNKELASIALQITHKNETLGRIKIRLEEIIDRVNEENRKELNTVIKTIEKDLLFDDDWDRFKMHFEDVHSGFFKRLKAHNNLLTPKDLRMCAYLRMNLSTKEISQLYNISIRGVEMARYRLRQKLDIPTETNLFEFLINI